MATCPNVSVAPACTLDLPYPEARACAENVQYADLLMHDYAGCLSELTAVTQYVYQHLMTQDRYPALSESLACVSNTEMRHMELLGELIVSLGGDPQYTAFCCGAVRPWSGDCPSFDTEPCAFLAGNIRAEQDAIRAYEERIRAIRDPNVQAVLRRIILDEQQHVRVFAWYREQLSCCAQKP